MRKLMALLLLALSTVSASAQSASDVAKLELLPGWRQADGTRMAGLRITLAPGWKTYWRAPGEAGIPPTFDWSGSRNLAAASTHYPVPRVFELNGLQTIGYHDEVVLPLLLRPTEPGDPIALKLRVELGVCETVCIPFQSKIDAVLPPDAAGQREAIAAALADVPLSAAEGGVSAVRCRVEPIADGLRLSATLVMPSLGGHEAAVIEVADPGIWVSEVDVRRSGDSLTATADLVPPHGAPFALDRSTLRFTVLADGRAVETRGCESG